jgi:hypothetical protein
MKFHSLMAAALLCAASSSHAALIHQFNLNGSLADAGGTTSLVALGGTVGASEYVFGANQGLRLDTKLGGVYSIDMEFRFDALYSYNRIIDFKNRATDNGFYTTGPRFILYPHIAHGGHVTAGENTRVTVTRDAAKWFRVYQNGELALSVLDTNNDADFGTNVAAFFRDNGSEAAAGAVDFIHVYDHAMSTAEVSALMPAEVPEPAPLGLVGAGLALLGWTRRRKQ